MKYAVVTFGCRVNQADSLAIEGALRARGGEAVPPEHADLVVVNTCSVTAAADQGARQTIRRVARENASARIVATGCYATRRPEELRALPGVVQVVSNLYKDDLVDLLDMPSSRTSAMRDGDGPCGAPLVPGVAGRTAFTLRVQTGCDEACSYCIIPQTRGRGRSRPIGEVVAMAGEAIAAGYREIALTGVHLGSYGRDLRDGTTLAVLLRAVAERDWRADVLFRVSSLEPMDCTDEVVEVAAASPAIAPHFHLPLQHASDPLLQMMRRPYDSACYSRVVERVRTVVPDASIGSDVIVGFPGETDADVEMLARFLERSPLTHVHVFPYSDRPGAPAADLPAKVPGPTVASRSRAIRDVAGRLARRFQALQVGSVRRALVVDDGTGAVTDNYLKLRLDRRVERNTWVRVRVGEHHEGTLVEAGVAESGLERAT